MDLIKQMNKTLFPETDPYEIALSETRVSPKEEMIKIADHWRTEGKEMETDDLRHKIAMELEMLEYRPQEVGSMVMNILKMIGREV